MNILSVETSTKNFSLAVARGGRIVASRNIYLNKVLSSSIIPAIEKILSKTNMSLNRLQCFAVGLGPGSFTSLRVGLATVKALSFATQKPVIGISSLDVLAMNVKDSYQGSLCVICDARRSLVYGCNYEMQTGHLRRTSKYFLTDSPTLLKKIKKKTLFLGDGIKLLKEDLEKNPQAALADERYWYPQAKHLCGLAWPRARRRDFDDAARLVPIYLYPDDCQVGK